MTVDATASGETARLARFARETRYADLPASTRHAARRAFVNIVGCCLGGAAHEIVETAAAALLPVGGREAASLIGRRERTDVLTATLLNGLASAAYSFDDTHADAILHPTGAVAAALMAIAEQRTMGGEDFITAIIIGIDVASRVSKAVSTPPARCDVGWSQTGISVAQFPLQAAGLQTDRSLAVVNWTNEEGVRGDRGARRIRGGAGGTERLAIGAERPPQDPGNATGLRLVQARTWAASS